MPVIFTTDPCTESTTGLSASAWSGAATDLGGRERVEDVGQPAAVDDVPEVVVHGADPVRDSLIDGLHER
jgi:hypothetical protein